jgi:fatty acid kinase fatty acid binding subunit
MKEFSIMINIITDTTSGLPLEISERYQIPVIPQIINFDNQSYYEGIDLNNQSFMKMLKASKALPKTAAPPPELFIQEFNKLIPFGGTIFCIHPSAELSGTVRSALMASQEFPDADIRIIDTRSVGSPIATLVQLAAEWALMGEDADSIEQKIRRMIPSNRIYFLVDTLEYLAKGGRIGGATALLGSVLKIKPILALSNGRVEQFEKARTQKHAANRLIQLVKSQAATNGEAYISVMHAAIPELAQDFANTLCSEFGLNSVPILDVPPAIVVHGGPGILAVAFFTGE